MPPPCRITRVFTSALLSLAACSGEAVHERDDARPLGTPAAVDAGRPAQSGPGSLLPGGEFPDDPLDAAQPEDASTPPEDPPGAPPRIACRRTLPIVGRPGDENYTGVYARIAAMDPEGNGYVVGNYIGTLPLGPDPTPGDSAEARRGDANMGFIAKVDAQCELAWVRRLGPPDSHLAVTQLARAESGALYAAGTLHGVTPFQPDARIDRGLFVMGLDANGRIQFTRSYVSRRGDNGVEFIDLAAGADGVLASVAIGEDVDLGAGTGQFHGETGGESVFALDPAGNTRFAVPMQQAYPVHVAMAPDGTSYLGGHAFTQLSFGGLNVALSESLGGNFIAQLSPAGDVVWHDIVDMDAFAEDEAIFVSPTGEFSWARFIRPLMYGVTTATFDSLSRSPGGAVVRNAAQEITLEMRVPARVLPTGDGGWYTLSNAVEGGLSVQRRDREGREQANLPIGDCVLERVQGVARGADMLGVTSSLSAPNTTESCPGYGQNSTIYTRLLPP